MNQKGSLPAGWTRDRLGDLVTVVRGASPRPKGDPRFFGGDIPWITIGDVTRQPGRYLHTTREGVTIAGAERSRLLKPGTLILSNSGTICLPKFLAVDGCIHDGFVAFLDIPSDLDPIFLYEFFNWIRPSVVNAHRQGMTQVNLNTGIVGDFILPIPPLPEQHRIVAAIESYFTRMDDAVASLERVQRNLKRYRASVLKAAVEGRLVPTEAALARAEGRDYEPASVLLQRILAERRRRWEKSGRKGKYVELAAPNTKALPELPEGWGWARVESLYWDAGYGTSVKCSYEADGPPVLRIPNVQDQSLRLDDMKFAMSSADLSDDGVVEPGDFLFIRTNGSRSLIGRGAAITTELPRQHHFASYLIRLRLVNLEILPRWIALAWHTPVIRDQILRDAASSAGQYNVSLGASRGYVVPLPPIAEQHRILEEVERRLSISDATEHALSVSRVKCSRLRQSILNWAFEGKLVDQEPNDEPASVLLERIRQTRTRNSALRPPKPLKAGTSTPRVRSDTAP